MHTATQQPVVHQDSMTLMFADHREDDVIYPLMVQEIAVAQQTYPPSPNTGI